jgi:hypothetical protein
MHNRLSAYMWHHTNAFSFTANQAALVNTNNFTIGLYGERRFMLQELSWYQTSIVLPTGSGNFGFKSTYFGNINNRELELGLAYGRQLGDKLAIGVQFNHFSQQIPFYGSHSGLSTEGGLLLRVSDQLQAGFHLYNPIGFNFTKREEKSPLVYTTGLGYEVSDALHMGLELQKVGNGGLNFNAGIDYNFQQKLFTRLAISTQSSMYIIGAGVLLKDIRLDILTSIHPQLGATPGISLLYQKKKEHD